MPLFVELSVIVVLATLIAFLMKAIRQPLIVGYIATGVLVGPYALNILQATHEIELFSKIGISILLFIVGLSLNPDIVREVGKTSTVTGIGQVFFTSVIGYFIVRSLGYSDIAALYTAVALTFSSTIIVLKHLTDRGDTGKLYGKISIGFLLVQDLVATVIMLVVSVLGAVHINSSAAVGAGVGGLSASTSLITIAGYHITILILKGAAIAVALYFISKYFLPRLSRFIAGNQETLFIFSLAWGLGMASLFATIGFSIEIGALVAGVTLAVSPFAYEMGARMKPLRDFFIILFFILLGAQMMLSQMAVLIVPALLLSAFVLIGNPLIVYVLMNLLGYRPRTAFMAGLTVAQISEFSLILIALGVSLGHIDTSVASLVTLVGIITITCSSYLFHYADTLYTISAPLLKLLRIRKHHHREPKNDMRGADIIIFGYDRVGYDFVQAAEKITSNYTVVDFNPQSIERLQEAGIPFRYGDAEDVEFLQDISFGGARLAVSTIPDFKVNLLLVKFYRKHNPSGIIIVISHDIRHAKELYLAGASYVVMPHYLGARHAAELISRHGFDVSNFEKVRNEHLAHLTKRESKR